MPIAPQKWGSELLVIGPEADPHDQSPAVAATADGGYVVAWNRWNTTTLDSIQLQRYDTFGNKVGTAIQIDNQASPNTYDPDVAIEQSTGNIFVAYRIGSGVSADVSIAVRSSTGTLVHAPTFISNGVVEESDVALVYRVFSFLGTSNYITAVWEDHDTTKDGSGTAIMAQNFLPDGSISGAQFAINTSTTGDQLNPDATNTLGGYSAYVWTDMNANAGDIKLKTLSTSLLGAAISEMTVNTTTAGLQDNASVAILSNGNIVVVWESGGGVIRETLSSTGTVVSGETTVNVAATDPHVAATQDGGFVISYSDTGSGDVILNSYSAASGFISSLTTNTTTTGLQATSDVAVLEDGRHVVFYDDDSLGSDGDVRGQIIDTRTQTFYGSAGDDTLVGRFTGMTNANDVGVGFGGNDIFYGLTGNDAFYGGDGNDSAIGDAGTDILLGEAGDDNLNGGTEQDYLFGGIGNDILDGGAGVDVLIGEAGNDTMYGGSGNDYLYGDIGDDIADGGSEDDLFVMADGNDSVTGGTGNDFVYGGNGNDTIVGGDGSDILLGEAGNDFLDPGASVDYVFMGTGTDVLYMNKDTSGVAVLYDFTPGAASGDVIRLIGTGWTSLAQVTAATVDTGNGYSILTLDGDTSIWMIGVTPAQLTADDFAFA
ncbi:MAG TPA: calcium-binding protein [Caulobacterales bacterium]|nr:calcium-binding protein [Caulobacterales bacterium]